MTRNITSADFDFVYNLYMHPLVNPFLMYEQMDADAFKPIFGDLLKSNIIYIFEMDGAASGMFKFIKQEHRDSHKAYLGGLAIDPSFSGKGYGLQMMKEIIELGKTMDILRIELSVATFNDKAISLYEKVGFVKEGVLRKFTHLKSEGRFIDEVMMSYLYTSPAVPV
jgi:L-phenylalanine/L-methionine N-acetyltransferase